MMNWKTPTKIFSSSESIGQTLGCFPTNWIFPRKKEKIFFQKLKKYNILKSDTHRIVSINYL